MSDRRARRLTDEVDAWIAVDDLDWPFSFVNVCQALHLDVSDDDVERAIQVVPQALGVAVGVGA